MGFLFALLSISTLFRALLCHHQYKLEKIVFSNNYSQHVLLNHTEEPIDTNNLGVKLTNPKGDLNPIKTLNATLVSECDNILHLKITDNEKPRFETGLIDAKYQESLSFCPRKTLSDLGVKFDSSDSFSFTVTYKNEEVFSFKQESLVYTEFFISFEALFTSRFIFGFGERTHNFTLHKGKYTTWPNDTMITYRDKRNGGYNLMGTQPIGLHRTKKGDYIGIIFNNINAQDTLINSNVSEKFTSSIQHVTIGGIIDYYLIFGETVDEVILNIHKIIGRPAIPPFWSFGWHQCKWGYRTTKDMENVYDNYLRNDLPIDTLWADVDILYKKRNFALDMLFSDLPKLIERLHKEKRHFVPITDYGIPKANDDVYYKEGMKTKAFLMSNYTGNELIGKVWPGDSVFPDFFTPSGLKLWDMGLKNFDKKLNYDGLWFDMNEPAQLEARGVGEYGIKAYPKEKNLYSNIPYIPGYRSDHSDLESKTISLNGYSRLNDPTTNFYTMYNVKPLINVRQLKATYNYLLKTERRPFIITRANTMGAGKYSFHWLGDNLSTYDQMRGSITSIFSYNIFGIPMTGPDICGFHNHTTDYLCARWHNLGTFYPFTRNHNLIYMKAQEPFAFGPNGKTLLAAKNAIPLRYSFLRYIYTQMMLISLGKKSSYFKPAFFEFPNDETLLENEEVLDTHIMAGSGIYYIPNFSNKQNEYDAYFPNENWNKITGEKFIYFEPEKRNKGTWKKLPGGFDVVNAFIKGGSIIPYQPAKALKVMKSDDLHYHPVSLLISPNYNIYAEGDFIYDNGDPEVIMPKSYLHVKITYSLNVIYFSIENNGFYKENKEYFDYFINSVKIFNADDVLDQLNFNLTQCEISLSDGTVMTNAVSYEEEKDIIEISFKQPLEIYKIKMISFY